VPVRLITTVALVDELLWIVSCPVAAPVVVGSNCTSSVTARPGFNVTGNVAPDIVKPVPVSTPELTVTGDVPVEVNVTGSVVGVFNDTLPNARLVGLIVNVAAAAFNCRAKVLETLPALAVSVTACAVVTDETVAVNPALVAFAATVTEAGTVTAALLLARLTVKPPVPAAAVSVTVQLSLPAPVIDALLQERALNTPAPAAPVPVRLITAVALVDELLWIVSCPVAAPVVVGSNCTFSVTDWVGFKVTGNVAPDIVNPVPVRAPELMVTGDVPVEVNVTGSVVGVFNVTLPNARLAGLIVNVAAAAFNCRAKVLETLPALAVSVTACAVVTDDTVAVNPALVAFAATVTEAGTVTAALLLARLTVKPPLPAAALSVTVQLSLPAPVIDAVLQERALNTPAPAPPVPVRLITAVALVDELLWIVSCPVAAPMVVGSNCTFTVTDWVGFKVTGNVAPDIVKPVPVRAAELMVTGDVPVEVNVTGSVVGVFNVTLPNARLAGLIVNVAAAAFNCRAKVLETLPALAVSVTACAVVTDDTVAVNPALVAFAATVTEAGTVTAALLLARLTVKPPAPAAALSDTVQLSLPAPVIDALLQERALNTPAPAPPVPVKLITAVALVDELLWIVTCPVAAPEVVGSNCTFSVTVWVGFRVTGNVAPDMVKPVPVRAPELMVTGDVPVEVNVTGSVVGVFNVTLPNARLAGLTVNCGLGTVPPVPLPLRLTTAVLLVDESLWIVSCPVAAPLLAGSNCTFSVTDWVGFKVTGNVAPDIVKPVPVRVPELMVTGAVPLEVNVRGSVVGVFTVTSPNARLAALTVNCGLATAVPVPLRLTTAVLLVDESLWIVSCPVAAPVVVGSNCTFSVTDWVGFKVTGNVAPDIVKPVPVRVPELMVTGAVPVEVNVTGSVVGVFTVTLPNVRVAALIVNCGLVAAVPVPLRLTTAVLLVEESL
jgi:hypothetical protein